MCCRINLVLVSFAFLFGCSPSDDTPKILVQSASFDFNKSVDGWIADVTDFPATLDDTATFELTVAHTDLPSSFGQRKGLMLSLDSENSNLFMFVKRKISGLVPNTLYNIVFEVELATNAHLDGYDASGSASNNLYLKAGAASIEPAREVSSNDYVLNIDKGKPNQHGTNAILLGNIATPPSLNEYVLITRSNDLVNGPDFIARTNSEGELWIFVGTDSQYQGPVTVYFTKVNLVFSTPY